LSFQQRYAIQLFKPVLPNPFRSLASFKITLFPFHCSTRAAQDIKGHYRPVIASHFLWLFKSPNVGMVRVKVPISAPSPSLPKKKAFTLLSENLTSPQPLAFLSPLFCSSVRGNRSLRRVPPKQAPGRPKASFKSFSTGSSHRPSVYLIQAARPHYLPPPSRHPPLFFELRRQSHRNSFVPPPFRAPQSSHQIAQTCFNSFRKSPASPMPPGPFQGLLEPAPGPRFRASLFPLIHLFFSPAVKSVPSFNVPLPRKLRTFSVLHSSSNP